MKNKFVYLLAFSATALVSVAAYFSVTGFTKLFSGAYWSMIIMISSLELAKLTVASFLYRYWDKVKVPLKVYFLIATGVLMLITSAGVYGFLSSAYSTSSSKLSKVNGEITVLKSKKTILQSNVNRISADLSLKDKRQNSLIELRAIQEARIDTLYKKGMISSVKKTERMINNADRALASSDKETSILNTQIQVLDDSISNIDIKLLELKNSDIKQEIGPLQYIATTTHKNMDKVANFFILLLVFVCDPLAVCLVIATNKVLMENESKKKIISQ